MTEISVAAMDNFARQGGMVGLAYFSLVAIILLIMWGFYWYVRSQRTHELERSRHHADQYDKRLAVEKELADSMHALVISIKGRPCMRNSPDEVPLGKRGGS